MRILNFQKKNKTKKIFIPDKLENDYTDGAFLMNQIAK
jgi:hypothetical protein